MLQAKFVNTPGCLNTATSLPLLDLNHPQPHPQLHAQLQPHPEEEKFQFQFKSLDHDHVMLADLYLLHHPPPPLMVISLVLSPCLALIFPRQELPLQLLNLILDLMLVFQKHFLLLLLSLVLVLTLLLFLLKNLLVILLFIQRELFYPTLLFYSIIQGIGKILIMKFFLHHLLMMRLSATVNFISV